MSAKVYIVDDDAAVRDALSLLLETAGLQVASYPDGASFLADIGPGSKGCVLLDMAMPVMSGQQVLAALQQRGIGIPVIFLTGHGDAMMAAKAEETGAVCFLQKPIHGDALIKEIRQKMAIDQ